MSAYEIDGPVNLGTSGATTTIKGTSVTFDDNSETINFNASSGSNTVQNFVLTTPGDLLYLNAGSALTRLPISATTRFQLRTSTTSIPEWTDTSHFDAIVDTAGNGDYTTVGAAFTGGAISVFVRAGTYTEAANITIPDRGCLVGERYGGVVLNMGAGFSITAGSTAANKTTAGTISVTSGTATVNGAGTDFDGTISGNTLLAGDYILLGATFYQIASVTSNILLTLSETYRGSTITAESYVAQTMINGVCIKNIEVNGATTTGISLTAARLSAVRDVIIDGCLSGLLLTDCGLTECENVISRFSTGGPGFDIVDSFAGLFTSCHSLNAVGNGITVRGSSRIHIFNGIVSAANSLDGLQVSGTVTRIIVNDSIFMRNSVAGVHVDSTASDVTVDGGNIHDNGSHGLLLDGSESLVTNSIIKDNTGDGVRPGDSTICNCNQIISNGANGVNIIDKTVVVVTGNRILSNSSNGIVTTSGTISECNFSNNIIALNTSWGINCTVGTGFTINANNISVNTAGGLMSAVGIGADTTIAGNVVDGNGGTDQVLWRGDDTSITGNRVDGGAGDVAINVTADNVIISSNRASTTVGSGTGISIGAGSDNCIVAANNYRGNSTTLTDAGTGTITVGNT